MKKFLLLLTVMLGLALSAQATEVTFTASEQGYANAAVVQSVNIDDNITAVFYKSEGSSSPKYYDGGTSIRCYSKNTITISSAQGVISKVVFTFGSSDGSNQITSNCGIYDSGTWTGSSESVKFTIGGTSGNRRISAITVTYDSSATAKDTLEDPVFSHEDGYEFNEPFELTITNGYPEGTEILYSLNGGVYQTYSNSISISETTMVSAYAVNNDYNTSNTVSASYYYVDPNMVTKTLIFKASGITEPADGYAFPNEELVNDTGYSYNGFNIKFGTSLTKTKDYVEHVRFYANATMTITPSEGRIIKKVELNVVDNTGTIKSEIGTCSGEAGKNQIWEGRTGDALVLTANGQIRFSYLTITYEESNDAKATLANPTFNYEDGYEFSEPFDLTISAEEGATIYYTLDGNDPTTESDVYSTPISITETTTVKAYAVKDGYYDSLIATATLTYVDLASIVKYGLVTSADQLVVGNKYLIADQDSPYALGSQAKNNRTAVEVSKNENGVISITSSDTAVALELGVGNLEDTYSFYDSSNNGYLYAVSSSSNYLRVEETLSDNSSASITISDNGVSTIIFQGTNTRNNLRYNSTSSIFSCYSNGQQEVALYSEAIYYIYLNDEAVGGDIAITSVVNADGVALTLCELEEGEWTLEVEDAPATRSTTTYTFNKRYAYVPANGQYTIKYSGTDANGEWTPTSMTSNLYFSVAADGTMTGVDEIAVDANAPVEYYNFQGVRVANPEKGMYIRVQGGKATKVILK